MLHLVGIGVRHSIAPPMHNFIAQSLKLPWTFHNTECTTVEEAVELARSAQTQGLVVTMPFKCSVMKHLDRLDPLATTLNACNTRVSRSSKPEASVWHQHRLARNQRLLTREEPMHGQQPTTPMPGLIVGAGGASRAAVFVLSSQLNCPVIYILNRDEGEVAALIHDSQHLSPAPHIIHVQSVQQATRTRLALLCCLLRS